MPIFAERFILPALAAIAGAVLLTNPMKWDWQSRLAALIALVAIAYLTAHQLHLRNEFHSTRTVTPSMQGSGDDADAITPPTANIEQSGGRLCSNIVAGRDAIVNCQPAVEKNGQSHDKEDLQ